LLGWCWAVAVLVLVLWVTANHLPSLITLSQDVNEVGTINASATRNVTIMVSK